MQEALRKNIAEICVTEHMPLSLSRAKDRLQKGTVWQYCARYTYNDFAKMSLENSLRAVAQKGMYLEINPHLAQHTGKLADELEADPVYGNALRSWENA